MMAPVLRREHNGLSATDAWSKPLPVVFPIYAVPTAMAIKYVSRNLRQCNGNIKFAFGSCTKVGKTTLLNYHRRRVSGADD